MEPIARAIAREGGRALIVGGWVRDYLLGHDAKDIDVEVHGLPLERLETILGAFGPVITVGRIFGVLRVKGFDVDFSLPRRDSKTGTGHRGFRVEFDPDLDFEAASRRRDLTINSMGFDPITQEVLDRYPFMTGECVSALIQAGRAEEALAKYGEFPGFRNEALLALGRWQEVLDAPKVRVPGQPLEQRARALLQAGRFKEAHASARTGYLRLWSRVLLDGPTEEAFAGNRRSEFESYAKSFHAFLMGGAEPDTIHPHELWLDISRGLSNRGVSYQEIPWAQYLLVPMARHLRGDETALSGVLTQIANERRRYQGGALYCTASYVMGRMSEKEFREQPRKQYMEGQWLLACALKAEREGQPGEALKLYRQYRDLPFHKKGFQLLVHQYVAWRIAKLETKP